jgi:AcrR family transcriptional regulator
MRNIVEKKPKKPSPEMLLAARREEILDAAARLFAQRGYANTDTQLLADELGVGKGTLYRYFPSKEELFLAAADRVMRELCRHIDERVAGIADPLEQIAEAIASYLAYCAEHTEYVELIIQERAQFKDRKKPTFFEHQEANVESWRSLYRSLIAEGRVRDMPVERITDVLSDLCYGTMFTNHFTGVRKPPEVQAREILDIVFRGILTDSERQRRH